MTLLPGDFVHCICAGYPANLDALLECSMALTTWAEDSELTAQTTFHIDLIVDELVTNVLTHGVTALQRAPSVGPEADLAMTIRLRVRIVGNGTAVRIVVSDNGAAFDPRHVTAADIGAAMEDRPTGGLGVQFVRQLTSAMHYRRSGQRNVLTLTLPTSAPG